MKIICMLRQRQLARLSVKSSATMPTTLKRHTHTCAECHHFYEDIRRIQQALPQALAREIPSTDFDNLLWARLQRQPQAPIRGWRSPYPLYMATMSAALCLVAVGYYYSNGLPEESVTVVTPLYPPLREGTVVALTPAGNPIVPTTKQGLVPTPHHRRTRKKQLTPKAKNTTPTHHYVVAVKAPAHPQVTWAQVGSYYAAQGEYRDAATAYTFAYQQQRDPRLAFVAGQAAENAGDPIQALELFTQTLQPKLDNPNSDKPGKDKHDETSSPLHSIRNCSSAERTVESIATIF